MQERFNLLQYEDISGEKHPHGDYKVGTQGSRLGIVNDGGFQPPEFGERQMRKRLPWQGCGGKSLSLSP